MQTTLHGNRGRCDPGCLYERRRCQSDIQLVDLADVGGIFGRGHMQLVQHRGVGDVDDEFLAFADIARRVLEPAEIPPDADANHGRLVGNERERAERRCIRQLFSGHRRHPGYRSRYDDTRQ